MKNAISLLFVLSFCAVFISAQGATHSIQGTNITLTYEIRGSEVAIVDCNGDASGALTIPASIESRPVTAIDRDAFYWCEFLTAITLPDTLESIGDAAFWACLKLEEITIPASVDSIGFHAFESTPLKFIIFEGDVPSHLQDLFLYSPPVSNFIVYYNEGAAGFSKPSWQGYNSELLPSSALTFVENPGYYYLQWCDRSASGDIYIPATIRGLRVAQIGGQAFANCSLITSVRIPKYVDRIAFNAFWNCGSLVNLSVVDDSFHYSDVNGVLFNKAEATLLIYPQGKSGPYSVPTGTTAIDMMAFYQCELLTSVQLPRETSDLDGFAFTGCTALTSFGVDANNSYFTGIEGVLYDKQVTTLVAYPEAKSGSNFIFPETVTTIGQLAFDYSQNLTDLIIPDTITTIEQNAFQYSPILSTVEISANTSTVDSRAFEGCPSLTSATFIGNAPVNFGSNVFDSAATNFTVYSYDGSSGFTYPDWNGYASIMLPNPNPDSDGDGWPDSLEALLGTDPNNAQDFLKLSITRNPDGTNVLSYEPHSDLCLFTLECTNDLANEDSWAVVEASFIGVSETRTANITATGAKAFYRIVVAEGSN